MFFINVNGKASNDRTGGSRSKVSCFVYTRVTACFAIVLLHCVSSASVYHADSLSDAQFAASETAVSMLMWAVPCFLMVSGALLLDPERSLPVSKLFGKYIRRMLTALIVFTLIFTIIKHDRSGGSGIVREFFDGLLFNHCMAYLWYLYLMLALYIAMPLFRLIITRLSKKQLLMLLFAVLAAVSILPLTGYFGIDAAAYIPSWLIYPVYLFIGRLLFIHKPDPGIAAAVFVLSTAALGILTHTLLPTDIDPAGLSAYNSPIVVLQSASAFAMMPLLKRVPSAITESIDRCSFGIYLIHMLFFRLIMNELGFDPYAYGPVCFAAMSAVIFFASYALTYALKKVPGFGWL